jgi:hypothetical protein
MHKARLAVDRAKWGDAIALMRGAAKNHASRARREASSPRPSSAAHLSQRLADIGFLVRTLYRSAGVTISAEAAAREAFEFAQQGLSSKAGLALLQVAARQAKGDGDLARLLRDRQDTTARRQADDDSLIRRLSLPLNERDEPQERALRDRLARHDARIREIDSDIAHRFSDFSANVAPSALTVNELQERLLSDDEALVLVLDTPELKPFPEETFVWVITKTNVQWVRSDLGTKALAELVAALRCGLDEEEWAIPSKAAGCGRRLGLAELPQSSAPLPFDLAIAHELYRALFGDVEESIYGKRLLIVPSGPLASLPFQVLVNKPPATARPATFAGYRNVPWLGRSHGLTVLPAVSSLKALRRHASRGERPSDTYIGYGDPLLKGDGASCPTAKAPNACPGPTLAAAGSEAVPGEDGARRATVSSRSARRSVNLGDVFAKGGGSSAVREQMAPWHAFASCILPRMDCWPVMSS